MIASTCIILKSFETALLQSKSFKLLDDSFWLIIFVHDKLGYCLDLSKTAFSFFHVIFLSHVALSQKDTSVKAYSASASGDIFTPSRGAQRQYLSGGKLR